jgi:cytochrome c-type biogenesis protein
MLIVIGSFLIINGIPGGHEWYETTFVHIGWNNLVSITPIPPEFHVGEHEHEGVSEIIPHEIIPWVLGVLIIIPLAWYFIKVKRYKRVNVGEEV